MSSVPAIEGADAIVAWFGGWPRFHDHYLLSAPVSSPADDGVLRIHAWVTNWNETNASGHFLKDRDCVVTFELSHITSIELSEPTFPAIISELALAQGDSGWIITWDSSYGAEGRITARSVHVELSPGAPTDRG